MAKPFDVTTKQLVEWRPGDWLALLGLPDGTAEVIDGEVSAVSAETDRVIRVIGVVSYLLHIEFQASRDAEMAARLARYNLLLWYKHRIPVESVVFLLRKEAEDQNLNGRLTIADASGQDYLTFRYRAVRVWELPPEQFLNGGVGLLPLAPLAKATKREIPGLLRQMSVRMETEKISQPERALLWVETALLMGLKFDSGFISQTMQGVKALKESSYYQFILDEGRVEGRGQEARGLLLRLGRKRFGEPDAVTIARLERITSLEVLEALSERLLDVESWAELLN